MAISHVVVGTGTASSRFLKTNWPIEEGLTLGSTKIDGMEQFLIPEGL